MSTRIAYVTDIHLDEAFSFKQGVDPRKNWNRIIADVSSRGIKEIVFGGDIGEKASNSWFFNMLKDYKVSLVLGNHDYFNEVIKYYNNKYLENHKECYYAQELSTHKLIFLDSSSNSISSDQLNWFEKELLTEKEIVLFIHHPILSVEAEVDKQFPLKNRDELKGLLVQQENQITIFCGHYHFNDEQQLDNIRQYITLASSYQMEKISGEIRVDTSVFGYRIIEFGEKEINTDLVLFNSN